MARYIDADKMQDFLVETNDIDDWIVSQYNADWISSFIENQPTADVVEVVKCGQCEFWKINPNNLYGGQCRYSECASIDHYCSRGKRKERKGNKQNDR